MHKSGSLNLAVDNKEVRSSSDIRCLLESLSILLLGGNSITDLELGLFDGLPELINLRLSENRI